MNKRMKAQLQAAFRPPMPEKKAAFLSSLPYPRTRMIDFFIGQAGYIRGWVWLLSLLAVAAVLLTTHLPTDESTGNALWITSSFLPFLALVGIMELARSASYNMAELEMSCRYSFSHVVLARLCIIGAADLLAFVPVAAVFLTQGEANPVSVMLSLFLPFVLTCALSLTALNRLRIRESVYLSGASSCAVCLANLVWKGTIYLSNHVTFSAAIFFILLVWSARELLKLIRKSEEFDWNLSLTA